VAISSGVLMLDVEGETLTADERVMLQDPYIGGIILFSRNVGDPQQLLALTASMRDIRPDILLAVDQEGGRVQRLKEGFTRLPPMFLLGQHWQKHPHDALKLAHDTGWLMASEVLAAGFDFSFAPVLDLHTGRSEVIGNRAFAAETDTLVALANAFMQGMHEAGMATTGKHFPGHGSVEADSHHTLPVDDRPLAQIRAQDLQPFVRCMPQLDAVMPAHVIYSQVDPHCAGFSRFWLQDILRGEMAFDGVVFSDDLVMAAASAAGNMQQRVGQALAAGCDMLLVCNNRKAALEALTAVQAQRALIDPASHIRMANMRRRQTPFWGVLQQSQRWQQVHKQLESFLAQHTL
jgi:beta-N-acetylhexosaminidase